MQKKMETGQGAVKGEMAGLRKEHEKRNKEVIKKMEEIRAIVSRELH